MSVEAKVGEAMYGVVLWSDRHKNCAVIWCEDHASLAFFRNDCATVTGGHDFGPGDLVEFEVREQDDLRLAVSPSVVAQDHYPGLADELIRAGQSAIAPKPISRKAAGLPGRERDAAHVLPFPDQFGRCGAANADVTRSGRKVG